MVFVLCGVASIFLMTQADLAARKDVSILRWFGLELSLSVVISCLKVLLMNTILFSGEIFQIAKDMRENSYHSLTSWMSLKNLFIAPFLEEYIYRACLINMMIESGALTPTQCIYITPLFFATSHLHWIAEEFLTNKIPFSVLLKTALFKLAYTELFGVYSGIIYVRTGSLWPAFLLHSQCNYFSFPHFWNLFKVKYRRTDRIIPGVLYVAGVIILVYWFGFFVPQSECWWSVQKIVEA
jgi:prenyl protein peptidase